MTICGQTNPANVKDGTLCLAQSPQPGSVGRWLHSAWGSVSRVAQSDLDWVAAEGHAVVHAVEQEARSDAHWVSAKAHGAYSYVAHGVRSDAVGAYCIWQAAVGAQGLAGQAMLDETGYQLEQFVQQLIPGLLLLIAVVGSTSVLGAGVGALVANAAGAVVGASLGFDLGMAALTWLGVGILAKSIVSGFGELVEVVERGIGWAWQARILTGKAQRHQIERASSELATSAGILMRLILQGMLAFLLKKVAMSSSRSAVRTVRGLRLSGLDAVSDATVAELVRALRASRFGNGFASWVEKNWRSFEDNPKLQPKEAALPPPEPEAGAMQADAAKSSSSAARDPGAGAEPGQPQGPTPGARGKRPSFVPDDWIEKPSNKGTGTKYVDPKNPHNSVRLEPAKPGSPNPGQQRDYMVVTKNGQTLNAAGEPVPRQSLDSHMEQGTQLPNDTFK